MGFHIAQRLSEEQKQVVVIDQNPDKLRRIEDNMDVQTVLGSGSIPSVLKNAGAGDEESNILSCLLAKSLGVKETVARVNKAAYLPLVEAIGIAHSVSPRLSAVNSILQYIRQGKVLSSVSVGGDAAEMLEALVDEESLVAGKRVHELGLPKGILLLGVIRGGEAFIPSGQTVIQPQDRIVLLSLREKMSKLEGIVSKKKE